MPWDKLSCWSEEWIVTRRKKDEKRGSGNGETKPGRLTIGSGQWAVGTNLQVTTSLSLKG